MDITETMIELSEFPDYSNMDVEELVNSLPIDQQAVLALDVSGFRQWEIALILGISRTTVWSKRSKALEQLKLKIGGTHYNVT